MPREEMLTVSQVAEEMGVAYTTVLVWLKRGGFRGALKEKHSRGLHWLIPRSDIDGFSPPRKGRQQVAKAEAPKARLIKKAQGAK